MLTQQTIQKLTGLKLAGMAKGFENQLSCPASQGLLFEKRCGMLVD